MTHPVYRISAFAVLLTVLSVFMQPVHASRTIVDTAGRTISLPDKIDRIICSGPGCLRLITYFAAQNLVVAVDDIETRKRAFDARPYALVNPEFKNKPVFGGFRGQDDPEKILGLDPPPQIIFKTYAAMGHDPIELENKTQIPVVILEYGDLAAGRRTFYKTLALIGQILEKQDRANELIFFFDNQIEQLKTRTKEIPIPKTCFIGGIAYKGPHGFQSTEPSYPPFLFVRADNIANTGMITKTSVQHSSLSKEKILAADPGVLFLDLSTLQLGDRHSGLNELDSDPVYKALTAVKEGRVYGVLPYNWYSQNFGSILADAWFIGKILYPHQFEDINPMDKADEIYEFLLSKPAFEQMNTLFENKVFQPVQLSQ